VPKPQPLREARNEALACRNIDKALSAPTLRQLAIHNSEEQVVTEGVVIMDAAMELFAANRRPPTSHVTEFVWQLMNNYPHESLADINVFAKGCAMSRWDEGEFYASVDVPRLSLWWTRFMEHKAEALERQVQQERSRKQREAEEGIGSVKGLSDAVGTAVKDMKMEAHEHSMRMRAVRLKEHAPQMTDDQLREQWKLNPQAELRSILYAEAERRGIAQQKMNEATDTTKP
jgi:hypothetical protein